MASQQASRSSRPRLQRGTDIRTPGQNIAYYREGRNRSLTAGGYTAARYQGQTVLATPRGSQVAMSLPGKTYHRYILAEFIACVAMIAGGMILIPAQGAGQGAGAAGRSFARQLVQLTAVCIVFFILALAGGGEKTGKVAAAFGGLVTLGVAWNLSEMWSGLSKALGGPVPKKKPSSGSTPQPPDTARHGSGWF
jgi:hypothetical protein